MNWFQISTLAASFLRKGAVPAKQKSKGRTLAQSIVEYVDTTLDNARIGRIHAWVFAIVTAGLFFDVIDFIILGSLVPDMVRTQFA